MKKLITIFLVLTTLQLNAQVALEQSYTQKTDQWVLHKVYPIYENYQGDLIKGYIEIASDTSLLFYDGSHNYQKEFLLDVPDGWRFSDIYEPYIKLASTHLFNMDDKVEFIVFLQGERDNGSPIFKGILYNEDGEALYTFNDYTDYSILIVDNKFKLFASGFIESTFNPSGQNEYLYDVYSLGGEITTSTKSGILKSTNITPPPYPNPTNGIIHLPYEVNKESKLSIYNIQGKLIESKQVSPNRSKLILDVSEYAKGMYFYKYGNESKKFIVD